MNIAYLTQEVIQLEINKQIKDYRILNKLTQKELGAILNVSDKTISSWENGRTYPDITMIVKLSELFNISLDTFLKEDKVMIKKIDRDLKFKNIYKYLLFGGTLFIAGVILFLNTYQYKNEWVDRFNPFMRMEIGYATLPKTVTYNGGKQYQENSKKRQFPDPYTDIYVTETPFGGGTRLTFSGGQSPKGKNYAIVQHKGLYVKKMSFIYWEAIPDLYRNAMQKEYLKVPNEDFSNIPVHSD